MEPLTNPTAHGGNATDAFDVVIPSLQGHGFSGQHIAHAWTVLMKRLGYTQFVAHGSDWVDTISEQMAVQAPPELLTIHTSMPATVPDDVAKALQFGDPAPLGLSADEHHAFDQLDYFYKHGLAKGDFGNSLPANPAQVSVLQQYKFHPIRQKLGSDKLHRPPSEVHIDRPADQDNGIGCAAQQIGIFSGNTLCRQTGLPAAIVDNTF
jgi:hypothetical protein